MGILDTLQSMLASKGAQNLEAALVPIVLNEVLGKGDQGGLSAIVAKLQQAGLGEQVKSWIGTGKNLPISAQQLQEALGSDVVKQLAAKFGVPVDQLSTVLAQVLPPAVDAASPNGSLPKKA
jgi:uncharacterized protein YidB (DUF937 family)